jgi:HlyD family secretion protein
MRGKWLLIAGVSVLAAIAVGALSLRRKPAPPPPTVTAQQAEAPASGDVTLTGRIRAQHVIGVGSNVTGTVEALLVDVGEDVAEGQILARVSNQGLETGRELAQTQLDNAQARVTKIEAQVLATRLEASRADADASRARTEFEASQKAYDRQRMLHSQGATPRNAYEKATREFEGAQADSAALDRLARTMTERVQALLDDLQNARKILDDKHKQLEDATTALAAAEIHAPADGTVVARKAEVGKSQAETGADLYSIATDTTALEVVLEPDPPTQKRLKKGQAALVLVSELSTEGIPATVIEVTDNETRVEFTSPTSAIRPGMMAEVRIRVD